MVTPADSHVTTFHNGPPTEKTSDPLSTSALSSLTIPTSSYNKGISGGTDAKGQSSNIWRCLGTLHVDTTPTFRNNCLHLLFFIRNDERRGHQAITWWTCNFIHWFQHYSNLLWPVCLPARTSAYTVKDTWKKSTQVFFNFKDPFFHFVYMPSTSKQSLLITWLHNSNF